jgi:hypothetical protein
MGKRTLLRAHNRQQSDAPIHIRVIGVTDHRHCLSVRLAPGGGSFQFGFSPLGRQHHAIDHDGTPIVGALRRAYVRPLVWRNNFPNRVRWHRCPLTINQNLIVVADCAAQGWAAIIKVTTRTTIVFCEFGIKLCVPTIMTHAMTADDWAGFLR